MEQPTMSFYDWSKQCASNEAPMDPIMVNKNISKMARTFIDKNYVMLLCHDRRDFTVFKINSAEVANFTKEMKEVLHPRGDVLFIDEVEGGYEIWIRDKKTNENFAYYMFDYSNAIVEVN